MLSMGGSGLGGSGHRWLGGGRGLGEGDRGHFHPPAMYCTTTWCFALKGLRTRVPCVEMGNCWHCKIRVTWGLDLECSWNQTVLSPCLPYTGVTVFRSYLSLMPHHHHDDQMELRAGPSWVGLSGFVFTAGRSHIPPTSTSQCPVPGHHSTMRSCIVSGADGMRSKTWGLSHIGCIMDSSTNKSIGQGCIREVWLSVQLSVA